MNKVKICLTIFTIAVILLPITLEIMMFKDNLMGLVIPPELTNLMKVGGEGNNATDNSTSSFINPDFQMPKPVGEPQYNPSTRTVSFTFNMENPVNQPVTVESLNAGIVSHNDGLFLGNLNISKPVTLVPGQTVDITTLGVLSDDAINYFKAHAQSQEPVNIDLTNLNVEVDGITFNLDKQNIGDITIPPGILG